jgi:hypothetical protein
MPKKKITLRALAAYLRRYDWPCEIIEDKNLIYTGLIEHCRFFTVVIDLQDESETLHFVIPQFLWVKVEHKAQLLEAMMAMNFKILLGRFEMDSNGEVRFRVPVPISGEFSFKDFCLAMRGIELAIDLYPFLMMIAWAELFPDLPKSDEDAERENLDAFSDFIEGLDMP